MRLVLGSLALLVLWAGCSATTDTWHLRCSAAFRDEIGVVEACLATARTADQRCSMELELALRRKAEGSEAYLTALERVSRLECGDLSLRARLRMAEVRLEGGDALGGGAALEELLVGAPNSYAAGEAVKMASRYRAALFAAGVQTWKFYLALYEQLKYSRVAGHLLYYSVQDGQWGGVVGARRALDLLVLLVDHHPESPYWDEAVVEAADLLSRGGYTADEVALLEDALLPNRARGMDALLDGFAQTLRLRLARLYGQQGRFEEALIQLGWVINDHSQVTLKDDGLWLASDVQRWQGDEEGARRTLEFLITQCPWSRHVQAAQHRLRQMKRDDMRN